MIEIETPNGPGRKLVFTPERIEQIKNLVERGCSREEIAEIIGSSVGSLQVTCSRLGISLRKPRPNNGVIAMPKTPKAGPEPPRPIPSNNGHSGTNLTLTLRHEGRERSYQIPLGKETFAHLALEASVKGISINELIAIILQKHIK